MQGGNITIVCRNLPVQIRKARRRACVDCNSSCLQAGYLGILCSLLSLCVVSSHF